MKIKKEIFLLLSLVVIITRTQAHKEEQLECHNYTDKALTECIFSHNAEEQRTIFTHLAPHQRKEHLKQLTYWTYSKFLDAYSELQWKELYNALTVEEKKYWPKTVKEQRNSMVQLREDADTVRNLALGANIIASIVFPPAFAVQGVELCYVFVKGIHPIVEGQLIKSFKVYLHDVFRVPED